jgi:hypothetical protein
MRNNMIKDKITCGVVNQRMNLLRLARRRTDRDIPPELSRLAIDFS